MKALLQLALKLTTRSFHFAALSLLILGFLCVAFTKELWDLQSKDRGRIYFTTYQDEINEFLCAQALSLTHFSDGRFHLIVYGLNTTKYGNGGDRKNKKLYALFSLCENSPGVFEDSDTIVFTDGSDVFYMRNSIDILTEFENTGFELLLSSERSCWPFDFPYYRENYLNLTNWLAENDRRTASWNFHAGDICPWVEMETFTRAGKGPYPFPNSGGFIGKWLKIREFVSLDWKIFHTILADGKQEDQASAILTFLLSLDKTIGADSTSIIFQSADFLEDAFTDYCQKGFSLTNRWTNTTPYIHHYNGGGKNLRDKCFIYISEVCKSSAPPFFLFRC